MVCIHEPYFSATGDYIGAGIAIGGVLIAWFWPRKTQKRSERAAFDAAAKAARTGPQAETAEPAQPNPLPVPHAKLQQHAALQARPQEAAVTDAELQPAPKEGLIGS